MQDEGYSIEVIEASSLFEDGKQVKHIPDCPLHDDFPSMNRYDLNRWAFLTEHLRWARSNDSRPWWKLW